MGVEKCNVTCGAGGRGQGAGCRVQGAGWLIGVCSWNEWGWPGLLIWRWGEVLSNSDCMYVCVSESVYVWAQLIFHTLWSPQHLPTLRAFSVPSYSTCQRYNQNYHSSQFYHITFWYNNACIDIPSLELDSPFFNEWSSSHISSR